MNPVEFHIGFREEKVFIIKGFISVYAFCLPLKFYIYATTFQYFQLL